VWVPASLVLVAIALGSFVFSSSREAGAQTPNRAAVTVSFGEGQILNYCIEFTEDEISGIDLLRRTGLSLVTMGGGMGAGVCKVNDTGCNDPNNCFCQCSGGNCSYWAYYELDAGQWKYAAQGASLRKVHNGDVDGWAWGAGSAGGGAQPPLIAFDQVCAPPASPTPLPPTAPPPPVGGTVAIDPPPTLAATSTAAPTVPLSEMTIPPTDRVAKLPTGPKIAQGSQTAGSSAADEEDSSFPVTAVAFGVVAAVLVGAAIILARRRSGG
jgi:hypothetical protein